MILVLILAYILAATGDHTALALTNWFDHHVLLTIVLAVLFA